MKGLWTWVLPGAAIGIAAAMVSRRANAMQPSDERIVWKDSDAPRRIRDYASAVEELAGWPGLGDFLVAVSYVESRGNSKAGSSEGNKARGWFGIRPQSSRSEQAGITMDDPLKSEPEAVALAAWYAYRMTKLGSPGQPIDWLAVRRGWAFPSLVKDTTNSRDGLVERITTGYKAAGFGPEAMLAPAVPERWPGIETVLAAVRGVSP